MQTKEATMTPYEQHEAEVARVWDVPRLSAEAAKVMWLLGEVMGRG